MLRIPFNQPSVFVTKLTILQKSKGIANEKTSYPKG